MEELKIDIKEKIIKDFAKECKKEYDKYNKPLKPICDILDYCQIIDILEGVLKDNL